jgi:cyclophilin family peptidyl-prolyl cis-trans isomerase
MRFAKRLVVASVTAALAIPFTAAAQSKGGDCTKVKLTTSMGPITLALDKAKAPISSENFAKYVKSGHYDGTIFHRVIDNFMIQGGGMTRDMKEKSTNAPIKNEATNGLKNEAYTVAMARTNDPNSATAQFFINVKDNEFLNNSPANAGYAVFGKVTEGKDVVDKMKKVATGNSGMHQNVPTTPVVLEKAECI